MATSNSSSFKSSTRKDGRSQHLFNGPGDGGKHGHVVQSSNPSGPTKYHYVRDVEGNVYIDDRKKKWLEPHIASSERLDRGEPMASSAETGGKPGIEKRPEWPPKKQADPDAIRKALGKTAIQGPDRKK
jgi:hypothetical protein